MEKNTSNQDINGKDSAKRKWGARMLWNSLAFFWFMVGLFLLLSAVGKPMAEIPKFIMDMWYGLTNGGFSAIGLTIIEHIINFWKTRTGK